MKVLVTGVAGQLGFDVVNELNKRGIVAIGTDIRSESELTAKANWKAYVSLDITDRAAVEKTVREISPDAIVHCAAWTNVDGAEDENNKPLVKKINVEARRERARVQVPLYFDRLRLRRRGRETVETRRPVLCPAELVRRIQNAGGERRFDAP